MQTNPELKTVVYKYDKKSSLSEKTLPGGLSESYEYDKEGRLLCKTLNSRTAEQGTAEPQKSGEKSCKTIAYIKYFYAKDGTLSAREVNGRLQKYEYDLKGQLIAVKESSTAPPTPDSGVASGTAMPLSSECGTGVPPVSFETNDWRVVEQYVYDPAGNILKKIVNGKETIFSYDKANQIKTALLPDGSVKSFAYDGAGRLVNDGDKSYTYGWLDKVTKVTDKNFTDAESTTEFSYFPDGQLASRSALKPDNFDNEGTADERGLTRVENFYWDGLALIKRDEVDYTVEPAVTGGNAILADNKVLFNDMLGSSLGSIEDGQFTGIERSSFGERTNNEHLTPDLSGEALAKSDLFTGKANFG